jgi:hypothetical protein
VIVDLPARRESSSGLADGRRGVPRVRNLGSRGLELYLADAPFDAWK